MNCKDSATETGLAFKNMVPVIFFLHFLSMGVGASPGKPVPVGGRCVKTRPRPVAIPTHVRQSMN